jgi:hypothetical protein
MKNLLIAACASLFIIGFTNDSHGQAQQSDKAPQAAAPGPGSGQVDVKTDRFSEGVTINLKPQMILDTPDQFITMRLEAKFADKKARDFTDQVMEILDEKAMVWFESQAKMATDFGDQELHFIIDGKRVSLGESPGTLLSALGKDPELKPGFKIHERFVNSLDTDQLKQLASGKHVEMRLGKYEFVLSDTTLGNLREFVHEFIKYAPSSKLKGRR